MLLFGVASIALLVLIAKQQVVLIISILIIGTIVTKTDFLLKIFALASGEAGNITETFYDSYQGVEPGTQTPISEEEMSKLVTQLIKGELERQGAVADKGKLEKATENIQKIIGNVELDRISERIGNATLPLRRVVSGGDKWKKFAEKFKGKEYFEKHIKQLLAEGLIQCPKENAVTCIATDTGRKVTKFITDSRLDRLKSVEPKTKDKPDPGPKG